MEQLKILLFHRNDRVYPIVQNSKVAVSMFQNWRWRLITLLEQLSGFWPYQRKLKQYPLLLFYLFVASTIFATVSNKWIEYLGVNVSMSMECFILMLIFTAMVVKLLLASTHQSSRQQVYETVAEQFERLNDPEEAAILNAGSEDGFKYAVVYMCIISFVVGIFVSIPVVRSFYNYFICHDELNIQMPIPMKYGFDHKEYWYIIALDFTTWMLVCLLLEFTYNLSFILQVRHAVALFKIVGIRLRKASELVDENKNESMDDDSADKSYSLISTAIDLHSECFKVVQLIETSYTTSWFLILLLSTIGFGAGIFLIYTKLHDPFETFRFSSVFLIVLLHFHMVYYQGQQIINSSESVSDECCEFKWYGLPKKSCTLLAMMLVRTCMPCMLTGAKLFPLSMETFSKMLKAGLSYYTVFRARM